MLYLSTQGNTKKILIENTLSNLDVNRLKIELVGSPITTIFEITFVETITISDEVVKALSQVKDRLKVTTTQRYLWLYLTKLEIRNTYKSNFDTKDIVTEPIRAICIGGSAGSIEKMLPILKTIPYIDISIFIVLHILPDKVSHLREIIQNVTGYKVIEASNHLKVKTGSIYIAPPNLHMLVSDGYIYLSDSKTVNHARPSIDVLFKSLAYEYKSSLLAILLCGYGSDGVDSLNDLSRNSSEVIIEDPTECEAKDIPENAIKTTLYNKVLGFDQIRHYLKSALVVNVDVKDDIQDFLENIYIVYGYDYRKYERNSLMRRIDLLMQQNEIESFIDFKRAVFDDYKVFDELVRTFSINVTSFFRDPSVYTCIKENVIPYIENSPFIRIWCAGCSRGDEAFSIAIILHELGLLEKSQIYATDFNKNILMEAKNAIYPRSEFKEAKDNYIQSGGQEEFEKYFNMYDDFVQVNDTIRKKVIFFQHNLVTDGSINEFNIVFCRNVLIYFDKGLQDKVFDLIDDSLFINNFLVLGQSEVVPTKYGYKVVGDKKNKIYKKGSG